MLMFSSFLGVYTSNHQHVKKGDTADRLFLLGLLCIQDEVSVLDMEQREGFEGVGPWYTSQVSRTSEFQQACQQNGVNRGASFLGLVLSVQGKTCASLC